MSQPPRSPSQVRIVAVCFHMPPAEFIARLQVIALRQSQHLHGVVVSNNPVHSLASPCSDIQVIPGSNAHLDFSGYFEGLERLVAMQPDTPMTNVLFVNDSLIIKHAAGCILRRVLSLNPLLEQLAVPAIGGKLDAYRSICLHNPWSGHTGYVSSYCFLLNARGLPQMRALPHDAVTDGVLTTSPLASTEWGMGMPPALRETIRAHLLYAGSPYLWQSGKVDDAMLALKKACCVYFESRLSGAIGCEGVVVPINAGRRSQTDIFVRETFARAARTLRGAR